VLGARYPDRFHTITLVQTPMHLRGVGDLMRGSYPSWADAIRTLGPGGWVTQTMPPGTPQTEWERAQWDRCDTDALCRLADATPNVDVSSYVPEMRVPTLLLSPAQSPLTSLADQLYLRQTIPDAELELFEGRGHTVYQDEPERCIARLRRFIAVRQRR
jgi:pimeloyl-ACP methyl ester carboxylesterase